jgi:hypothetical protein
MNTFKIKNKIYKYESVFPNKFNNKDTMLDFLGKPILLPPKNKTNMWSSKTMFLSKLECTQGYLKNNNHFEKYDPVNIKDCLLCDEKKISTGLFTLNKIRWEDGLTHYIDKHNIKPSNEFIDIIFKHQVNPKVIAIKRTTNLKGKIVVKNNKQFLKLDRNQILIMDALMEHGGKKQYIDDKNNSVFRYSEHAGLLDFDNNGLQKIIVYGNSNRIETNDNDIFFPGDMVDAYDYEYIFHTHPPTPKPGGRANIGIIYEFPSISDIFHFIEHYNQGNTQGSIVITPEGMYIIRKFNQNNKMININMDNLYKILKKTYKIIFDKSYKKYGEKFSAIKFYSVIAQDVGFITMLNIELNKFDLHIDYYPRIKDQSDKWIIDTIYIPVYVVEAVDK